ncbi:MAG: hypothetical protein GF353_05535 [Candidatus Lokiarchaeota archaeon]|nr:hypothetical protein [Candidatus Lokiarchaeota archaeon]
MILPEKHFKTTYELIKKIDKRKIARWLLEEGYYPEQYVLPPCFCVNKFDLQTEPYFKTRSKEDDSIIYNPERSEQIFISFPKSQLTERTFGIMEPRLYHDIVWYLMQDWEDVISHLFNQRNKIYSYSFPIPVNKKDVGNIGPLRAGRLIYEFIEMAENDIVAEAHRFKYILIADIKNFYPSIYTHSIVWALHDKRAARKDIGKYALLGSKIDRLLQNSNDRCTNGIPIGSAVSDLISEILLASIDRSCSEELKKRGIQFVAVRFKDDYRFLCESKNDADTIIKILQGNLRDYNLSLSESKTVVNELPEGLFRQWTAEYQKYSLKYYYPINYKQFEMTLRAVLNIDQKYPNTGIVDKFLSELVSRKFKLKLRLNGKEILKVFSLLFLLKERRSKAFPQILAIIEMILDRYAQSDVVENLIASLEGIFKKTASKNSEFQYDTLWLYYFFKSTEISEEKIPGRTKCKFLQSVKANSQKFYKTSKDIKLYQSIKKVGKNKKLVEHLAMFSNF